MDAERPYDPTLRQGELQYLELETLLADPATYLVVVVVAGQVVGSGFARLEAAKPYLRRDRLRRAGFHVRRAGPPREAHKRADCWRG